MKSCLAAQCPALASEKSLFGYCPIHHKIATDPEQFNLALKNKITPLMYQFAKDIERGIYPKSF